MLIWHEVNSSWIFLSMFLLYSVLSASSPGLWREKIPESSGALPFRDKLQEFVQFFIGEGFFVGLVVDGEQVNGVIGHQKVGDHPGAARLAPAFGLDSQADFVAAFANGRAPIRVFLQLPYQGQQLRF